MGDHALFRSMTADNLVELYPEKLADIHSYAKADIIEFLAPVLNSDAEVDARCDLLSSLREKLCQTLCDMFAEFGTRELYNRRLPHTYANDIYLLGNSIRNSNIDKHLKVVFKPAHNNDNPEHDANPDVSIIDQTDVIETCLLLRDSVVSLKAVIHYLQQEVTDLRSHVVQLDAKLVDARVTHNPAPLPHHPEGTPADETTAPLNGNVTDDIQPENVTTDPTETNADFRLPINQQKKLLTGRRGTPTQRPGIVGKSKATHSFSGINGPTRTQMRSLYIGNCGTNASITSVRAHLVSIDLADALIDIQSLDTKYSDMKLFCITLNSTDAENKAYESVWPNNVVVRPYRPPRKGYGNHSNQRNNGNQMNKNTLNNGWSQNNQQQKGPNKQSGNRWHQTKFHGNVQNKRVVPMSQPSPYLARPVQHPVQHSAQHPVKHPVQHPVAPSWSGIYPAYNGQFMPLMSLPSNL